MLQTAIRGGNRGGHFGSCQLSRRCARTSSKRNGFGQFCYGRKGPPTRLPMTCRSPRAQRRGISRIRFFHSPGSDAAHTSTSASITCPRGVRGLTRKTPGLERPASRNSPKCLGIVRKSWVTRIRSCSAARAKTSGSRIASQGVRTRNRSRVPVANTRTRLRDGGWHPPGSGPSVSVTAPAIDGACAPTSLSDREALGALR
jgi:hypothetical protein